MSIEKNIKNTSSADEAASEKNNNLSLKTINRILICLICILLLYIIGMQIIDTVKLKTESEISFEMATESENTTTSVQFTVNINTDDPFELTRLKGIGESKARSIIEYRKENGDFIAIEELMKVPGIGEALFESIKNHLSLE